MNKKHSLLQFHFNCFHLSLLQCHEDVAGVRIEFALELIWARAINGTIHFDCCECKFVCRKKEEDRNRDKLAYRGASDNWLLSADELRFMNEKGGIKNWSKEFSLSASMHKSVSARRILFTDDATTSAPAFDLCLADLALAVCFFSCLDSRQAPLGSRNAKINRICVLPFVVICLITLLLLLSSNYCIEFVSFRSLASVRAASKSTE